MEMEFNASTLMQRIDDVKSEMEMECRNMMTLHCAQCNTVLADSLVVCGELECLDSILCSGVTHDVIVSDEVESGLQGEMAHCIHSCLRCAGCRSDVGSVIHSAPQHLDMLRSIFLLRKANISCYSLNSGSLVKASKLSFDLKPLGESISQVTALFQAQSDRMSQIKKTLAERSSATQVD